MAELWDIYDKNRRKTGKTVERSANALKDGEYHVIITGIIMNSNKEILVSKRAPHKKHGLKWEFNGGSLVAGEESKQGVLRELKEELGVEFTEKDAVFFKEIRRDEYPSDFKDQWLFKKDFNPKELKFPDGEAIEAKWVTIDEFMKMVENKEMIDSIDFGVKDYKEAINKIF